MRKTPCGFTLIELLIVVAIISVLAAISVPNFLEAQVRSKTSRMHADMSVVASALRCYAADHNQYPSHSEEVSAFLNACRTVDAVTPENTSTPIEAKHSWHGHDPFAQNRPAGRFSSAYGQPHFPVLNLAGENLWQITTPIAYCGTALPTDVYHDVRTSVLTYINLGDFPTTTTMQSNVNARYVLLSYGPDTDSTQQPDFVNPLKGPWLNYDPTNGTVSNGDILRFGNNATGVAGGLQAPSVTAPTSNYGDEVPI